MEFINVIDTDFKFQLHQLKEKLNNTEQVTAQVLLENLKIKQAFMLNELHDFAIRLESAGINQSQFDKKYKEYLQQVMDL